MPWVDDHACLSCSKLQRYHNLCKRVKDILNEYECFLLLLVELNAGKGPSSHFVNISLYGTVGFEKL